MADYQLTFHCGETRHTIAVTTDPEDEQSLEEWLAEKLERRTAAVDTPAGPVLIPTSPRFAAFETADGGFQMIPTDKIDLVDVSPVPGDA